MISLTLRIAGHAAHSGARETNMAVLLLQCPQHVLASVQMANLRNLSWELGQTLSETL
jgi:hypothetical protein